MVKSFDDLLLKIKDIDKKKVAIAVAQDKPVLEAAKAAKERDIADAILVGNEKLIREIGAEIGMNMDEYEIINVEDDVEASLKAVSLVSEGKADIYMKGLLATGTFLKSVLNKEVGLRTGKPLSHVCVIEVPKVDRVLFLSDVAFMPYPTLEEKKCIIEYTSEVAKACGVEEPKVAVVAAVETVNPKMPATVDADALSKMQDNGEITGCVVEGPLSLDIALFPAAAAEKGAEGRKVAGNADVLVFPDIQAGNLVYKTFTQVVENMKNGCILTGTKAPVVLTSRADTFETKVNSIALAAIVADGLAKNK